MTSNSQQSTASHAQASAPMPWVARWLQDLRAGASVLDLACGQGRHATLAASMGYKVLAVDRNQEALDGIAEPVRTLRCDLESDAPWPFADASFDAIIVTNYLYRPGLDALVALLAPGGRLIYATFALGNERYGRPRNPDFLLAPGELLELARRSELRVAGFESGLTHEPASAVVERLCAWRVNAPELPVVIDWPENATGQLK